MPTFSCNLFVLTKRGGEVFVRITTQGGDIYTSIRNVFVYWGHVPYPLHDSAANARHYKEMRAIKVVAYDVNVCLFNHHLPFRSFQRVIILKTNKFVLDALLPAGLFIAPFCYCPFHASLKMVLLLSSSFITIYLVLLSSYFSSPPQVVAGRRFSNIFSMISVSLFLTAISWLRIILEGRNVLPR